MPDVKTLHASSFAIAPGQKSSYKMQKLLILSGCLYTQARLYLGYVFLICF